MKSLKPRRKEGIALYAPSRQLRNFHVRGFQYWDGALVVNDLKTGSHLELRAEFDNPHDANAIALYFGGSKLGYVPADMNEELALMFFYGHEDIYEARILQVNVEEDPWKQVRVGLFVKDSRKN